MQSEHEDQGDHPEYSGLFQFKCNICGKENTQFRRLRHRELLNCSNCNSSARVRGVVYALQRELLGDTQTPLQQAQSHKHLSGLGMSDWAGYSNEFDRLFNYTNTFYHQEPRLDVTNAESAEKYKDLDFVISSDVLEHVISPVSQALINIRNMMHDKGVLILTVPYLEGYESIEHFPHLHDYKVLCENGKYYLENKRADGNIENFNWLSFHGGPGSVLEMRIFGEGDLFGLLNYAGFTCDVLQPNIENIGFSWDDCIESPLWRNRKTKAYVLICRPRLV